MRSYSVEGIVIKRANIGESDKLITIFSSERGKLTLKAKGIRKISSRRAGSLELFNHIKASASVSTYTDILTEVQTLSTYPAWRKHLGRVNIAYQLCEIIDKLLPEGEAHPEVYATLASALSEISSVGSDWKLNLESWILNILRSLGYWPHDKPFTGDLFAFVESLIERPLNSPKLLKKLV